ncbi:MAG: UDP-N-acetylmuramoyl-L-alanyl-D-glutamate--2,6-diaminopimelate ligase [bacterium]
MQKAGIDVQDVPDITVTGLTDNSQTVEPGNIFVATIGQSTDSHVFISDAKERGATVMVVSRDIPAYNEVVIVRVPDSMAALGSLAHAWHGNPSAHMLVVGVSGTNGKTTTTYLLESVMRAAGMNPGVIGTIEYRYAGQRHKARHTTPTALQLAQLYAQMRDAGCDAAAMEVSSHSIEQQRINGIRFDAGIFTNLTQDHLDYHGTMENYAVTKRKFYFDHLLRYPPKADLACQANLPIGVFNMDDACGKLWASEFPGKSLTYGTCMDADLCAEKATHSPDGTHISARCSGQPLIIDTPLFGQFNVLNVLGAYLAGVGIGITSNDVLSGIKSMRHVPGRFESVAAGQPFFVIVDYAHTPDALKNVLVNARTMTDNRIITVFGCGGDRDPFKRPLMGRIVGDLSDHVILTNDNPRTEDPEAIAAMALEGLRQSKAPASEIEVILDRRAAIGHAAELARKGDFVMIAGKGHEDYQILKTETIHFDDRETAREWLISLGYSGEE